MLLIYSSMGTVILENTMHYIIIMKYLQFISERNLNINYNEQEKLPLLIY